MSAARDEVLRRIRGALADVPAAEAPADVPVVRDYRRTGHLDLDGRVALLAARVADYRADVSVVTAGQFAGALRDACAAWGLARVVVPPGLPDAWAPGDVEVIRDTGLGAAELDGIDGAVTGCATAIAETGTLVLDGRGPSGRRIITLVPDHHICIVKAEQIVQIVPEAIAALAPAVGDGAPVTLISGPSASSDIELSRVEGVHGPRHLHALILTG